MEPQQPEPEAGRPRYAGTGPLQIQGRVDPFAGPPTDGEIPRARVHDALELQDASLITVHVKA